MDDLIIERPQAQSPGQKAGQRLLTAGFWLFFIYLIRPVFSLFAWAVGIARFTEVMIIHEGLGDLLALLKWYALVIGVMTLALESWAMYNLLRFRGKERRRAAPAVSVKAVAAFFRVDAQQLLRWTSAQILCIHHDKAGNIRYGETLVGEELGKDQKPAIQEAPAAAPSPA